MEDIKRGSGEQRYIELKQAGHSHYGAVEIIRNEQEAKHKKEQMPWYAVVFITAIIGFAGISSLGIAAIIVGLIWKGVLAIWGSMG